MQQAFDHYHFKLAEFLVHEGADINKVLPDGEPILHNAVQRRDTEMIQKIINMGADVNKEDRFGDTAVNILPNLINDPEDIMQINKILIKNGADINHNGRYGHSPLFDAIQSGHIELAEYYLNHGADIRHPLKNGKSMTQVFVERDLSRAIRFCKEHLAMTTIPQSIPQQKYEMNHQKNSTLKETIAAIRTVEESAYKFPRKISAGR